MRMTQRRHSEVGVDHLCVCVCVCVCVFAYLFFISPKLNLTSNYCNSNLKLNVSFFQHSFKFLSSMCAIQKDRFHSASSTLTSYLN